jgi:hypothetical protein
VSCRIVRTHILVQTWLERLPTVDEARPQQCPGCEGRHHEDGCSIQGHGLRSRTVWGPPACGEEPTKQTLWIRRYRCVICRCVIQVVPAEVGPYVSFTLPAILAALAHWALEMLPPGKVLAKLSPVTKPRGFGDPWLWSSLRRWVRRRRILFPTVEVQDRATLRQTAAVLVAALVSRLARAPPVPQVPDAWAAALLA